VTKVLQILQKGDLTRIFFAFAMIAAEACGSPSASEMRNIYPKNIKPRLLPRPVIANPLQCKVESDCGVLPHVADVRCLYGYCLVGCEQYWGNCNKDYRDGCETSIKRPCFCDGDPNINDNFEPSTGFFSDDLGVGPGRFNEHTFARGMDDQLPILDKCYKEALKKNPALGGRLVYKLTLGEDGRITAALLDGASGSYELQNCVAKLIKEVYFDPGPVGGSVTYTYRVIFVKASDYPNSE
jgi:TonB family protein